MLRFCVTASLNCAGMGYKNLLMNPKFKKQRNFWRFENIFLLLFIRNDDTIDMIVKCGEVCLFL